MRRASSRRTPYGRAVRESRPPRPHSTPPAPPRPPRRQRRGQTSQCQRMSTKGSDLTMSTNGSDPDVNKMSTMGSDPGGLFCEVGFGLGDFGALRIGVLRQEDDALI